MWALAHCVRSPVEESSRICVALRFFFSTLLFAKIDMVLFLRGGNLTLQTHAHIIALYINTVNGFILSTTSSSIRDVNAWHVVVLKIFLMRFLFIFWLFDSWRRRRHILCDQILLYFDLELLNYYNGENILQFKRIFAKTK